MMCSVFEPRAAGNEKRKAQTGKRGSLRLVSAQVVSCCVYELTTYKTIETVNKG